MAATSSDTYTTMLSQASAPVALSMGDNIEVRVCPVPERRESADGPIFMLENFVIVCRARPWVCVYIEFRV